jgi:hypothetical protein
MNIMARPIEWPESSRFHFRVTFVEALMPVFARGWNSIIGYRDLERGGPLSNDLLRQVSQEFDRDRVASCGQA